MKSLAPRTYPLRWIIATLFLGALVLNWLKWREPARTEPLSQTVVITIQASPAPRTGLGLEKRKLSWPEWGHHQKGCTRW